MVGALTEAKRRIVDLLVRTSSASVAELAQRLELTEAAVRQHLDGMESIGLVERDASDRGGGADRGGSTARVGRGRPPARWRLTGSAHSVLPDRHRDLSGELIASIRAALGEVALNAVLRARAAAQRLQYESVVGNAPVAVKLQRLAEQRTREGYLAEILPESVDDGEAWTLIEHHCPISSAASSCTGLCSNELTLFREVLGPSVVVERTQHLLAGQARCAYRISGPSGLRVELATARRSNRATH